MFSIRCSNFLCSQTRYFSKSLSHLERFSRESLRNRIYKQNIKDITKQTFQNTESLSPTFIADTIPIRPARDLWKALGFTFLIGSGTFTIAIVADIERSLKKAKKFQQAAVEYFNAKFALDDKSVTWEKLSPGDKHCLYLLGANFAVFLLWRIKSLQPMMWRYFSNSFASRSLCLPMLLSAFSHSNFIHFGLNMYVLYSFASLAIDRFVGSDQFWAFYCTAAVVSSLTSLIHKSAVRSSVRALGASGAILALLTYTCMKMPDARLKIVFVPLFDFSAQAAVVGILVFDLCGLLFKFRLFDHAAHLGGALFGVFYALLGEHLIWRQFGNVIDDLYKGTKDSKR